MDLIKFIKPLSGEADWQLWKRKIKDLLDFYVNAVDVIEGNFVKPEPLKQGAEESVVKEHNKRKEEWRKANSIAKSVISNAVTDEIYQRIMDKETAYEAWQELKSHFEATSKDQVFKVCSEFFAFNWNSTDDVSTHIAKVRNLWNELNNGLKSRGENALPDMILVCKVLSILPNKLETFKSSWMLLTKDEKRTFDELTAQLCMYERNFSKKETSEDKISQEAFIAKTEKQKYGNNNNKYKKSYICNYCNKKGHWLVNCRRWIADGKPSKNKMNNGMSMLVSEEIFIDKNNTTDWYIDNGATKHITNNSDYFINFQKFNSPHSIFAAGKEKLSAIGKGDIKILAKVNNTRREILLNEVWYVPKAVRNLFSTLAAQDRNANSEFISLPTKCSLKVNNKVRLQGYREVGGTLYKADIIPVIPRNPVEINSATTNDSLLQLYHKRWGHQDKKHVMALLERELNIKVKSDDKSCEPCMYGKFHRLPFGTREKTKKPGELISADVCGPFTPSFQGKRYLLVFKDNYSKFKYVYLMKEKSEVKKCLINMLKSAEALGHRVQEFLSDNGGEFDNEDVREILSKRGIIKRTTAPYTPQQNGSSEREFRTIVEMARTFKYSNPDVKFPEEMWAEFVSTAVYVLNRTGKSSKDGVSPYELWMNKKPRIKHLRIITSECYFYIPAEKRKKMDKKACRGYLVGYDGDERYRIWEKESHRIFLSRDVKFTENGDECDQTETLSTRSLDFDTQSIQAQEEIENRETETIEEYENEEIENKDAETIEEEEIVNSVRKLRNRSSLKQPTHFQDFILSAEDYVNENMDPQLLGTVRSILSMAASEKMHLTQFDVSTAFLYGYLEEEIYMNQPEGYDDGSNKVCKLNRSLYGLKQSPRCWNNHFNNFLKQKGFKVSEADSCLYTREKDNKKLFLVLYVDDGLIAATSKEDLENFVSELGKEFKITSKQATYFLGLEIKQNVNGDIKITQDSYLKRILERFNFLECKSVSTPILKQSEMPISGKATDFPYRSAVGALMYLMIGTRPDIAYTIGYLSRSLENPSSEDIVGVKRVFRYLQGTKSYGIIYKHNYKKGILECYSDADFGGCMATGRSTTGVVVKHAGGAISWLSQRQPIVATSTTEAEIISASEATREVIWLTRLFNETIGLAEVPVLQVDNSAAVKLAQNPEFHKRTKHIRIKHFFVREKVTSGELKVQQISTEKQVADIMTKPLSKPRLLTLCSNMGVE